jgi:hypothetical protein
MLTVRFKLCEVRVEDVVALVRYACSEGLNPGQNHEGEADEMRDLIVAYAASEHEEVDNTKEFLNIVEEGGEFMSDLHSKTRIGLL